MALALPLALVHLALLGLAAFFLLLLAVLLVLLALLTLLGLAIAALFLLLSHSLSSKTPDDDLGGRPKLTLMN